MIIKIFTVKKNEYQTFENQSSTQRIRSAKAYSKTRERQIIKDRQQAFFNSTELKKEKTKKKKSYAARMKSNCFEIIATGGICYFSKDHQKNNSNMPSLLEVGKYTANNNARMYEEIKKRVVFLNFFFFSLFIRPSVELKNEKKKKYLTADRQMSL